MKSMFKLGTAVAVSLLLTLSAFGAGCCRKETRCEKRCEKRCDSPCGAPCKLPSPKCTEVQYTTECEGTPKYHWVCQKVYEPCTPKNTVTKKQVMEQCTGVFVDGEEGNFAASAPAKAKKNVRARQ